MWLINRHSNAPKRHTLLRGWQYITKVLLSYYPSSVGARLRGERGRTLATEASVTMAARGGGMGAAVTGSGVGRETQSSKVPASPASAFLLPSPRSTLRGCSLAT